MNVVPAEICKKVGALEAKLERSEKDLGAANRRIEVLEGMLAKQRTEQTDGQQSAYRDGVRYVFENAAQYTGRFNEGSGCEISDVYIYARKAETRYWGLNSLVFLASTSGNALPARLARLEPRRDGGHGAFNAEPAHRATRCRRGVDALLFFCFCQRFLTASRRVRYCFFLWNMFMYIGYRYTSEICAS